jgi:molybdenum cofactor biosynthesis enzyme
MEKLSHYDDEGSAHMVDVSGKASTRRELSSTSKIWSGCIIEAVSAMQLDG